MLIAEKHRLRMALVPDERRYLERHVDYLEADFRTLEKDLKKVIESGPAWLAKEQLLRNVPGVGKILAVTLMGGLPELGDLSRGRAVRSRPSLTGRRRRDYEGCGGR